MLVSLSIRDFVLITRLDLDPVTGFTSLTGETGAGKSIILDALGAALGGKAEKRYVRAGTKAASVTAEFAPEADHAVWALLDARGVEASAGETLTLRRHIPKAGPSRAFLNDQAVSAALLGEIGETLVEIHGQHAASALMKPSRHRILLDQFAGNDGLLAACSIAWATLAAARAHRQSLEANAKRVADDREYLTHAVAALEELSPDPGEAAQLASQRALLMQTERIIDAVSDASSALYKTNVESALTKASRAVERIRALPEIDGADPALAKAAIQAGDALERTLIELSEAASGIQALSLAAEHDSAALDRAETRLFALRAEGRKYSVDPDGLADLLTKMRADLAAAESSEADLSRARQAEASAAARWHSAAERLTRARKAAAGRLKTAIEGELKPLKLGSVSIIADVSPLPEDEHGAGGADHVEFLAETNPGAGYGPLRKIASGGELARFSLAVKCALAEAGGAPTLIFDEADQGVGGAVAAAVGERLSRLAGGRQVFAITHSPQVAACASDQWLVEKGKAPKSTNKTAGKSKLGQTRVRGLDDAERTEEIARMLSGATVTPEARAAAMKLLESP